MQDELRVHYVRHASELGHHLGDGGDHPAVGGRVLELPVQEGCHLLQ